MHSYRFAHMTDSDLALAILSNTADCIRPDGWHTLPLDGTSKWIHIVEEENVPV